jgi:hypothetical protein
MAHAHGKAPMLAGVLSEGIGLGHAFEMVQNAYMAKNAALTVRIAESLKRRIEARAARENRSLSAQVEYELSKALGDERLLGPVKTGKLLGRYAGATIPTAVDYAFARKKLWSRLSSGNR